jgi:hypothetical protein
MVNAVGVALNHASNAIPRRPEWPGINVVLTQSIWVLRLSNGPACKPIRRQRESERKYPLHLH